MTMPRWLAEFVWVGAGGFLGAGLRYAVSGAVNRFAPAIASRVDSS
jgi:fluoride ion exporter CrcB/FEX